MKIGKNRLMNKGVYKSIPFFDFFSYQNYFFLKRGCKNLINVCIIFVVFGREK